MCLQEGFKKLPALRQKDELLWALASARLLNLSDAQRRKGPPTKSVMGAFDWEGVVETLLQKVVDARDEALANATLIVGNLLSMRHVQSPDQRDLTAWAEEVSEPAVSGCTKRLSRGSEHVLYLGQIHQIC